MKILCVTENGVNSNVLSKYSITLIKYIIKDWQKNCNRKVSLNINSNTNSPRISAWAVVLFEGGDREWFFIYPRLIICGNYVQSMSNF